jgi:DNA-binding SARP family transcriptional activator
VLVVGYPRFFPPDPPKRCGTGAGADFTEMEMPGLNQTVDTANRTIKARGPRRGIRIRRRFPRDGRSRVCADESCTGEMRLLNHSGPYLGYRDLPQPEDRRRPAGLRLTGGHSLCWRRGLIMLGTHFRILGPLDITQAGEPIRIRSRRQRTVLATLLLDTGRVVSVDRLTRAVWGERTPDTARTQIHHCVSLLRRRLGAPELISTRPAGYLLAVTAEHLDALAFEQCLRTATGLVAEGRPEAAADELRRGLALWRGPALTELDSPLVAAAVRRLDDRRLAAWEKVADLELSLHREHTLVADLPGVLAEAPMRERLAEHLMIALYRSGRQAEALDTYQRVRTALVEGQGLEPGAGLQELQRRILTGDPALHGPNGNGPNGNGPNGNGPESGPDHSGPPPRPASGPAQLPPVPSDFTGREEPLERIVATLCGPWPALPAVTISGPPGIGKSTLALQAADRVRRHFSDGQLYVDLGGAWPDALEPLDALGRCLRALGVPDAAQPENLDERAAMFRDRLSDRRVLVVLDDAGSAAQVRPLLPGAATCAVLITSRQRLTGLAGATHVPLPTFTPAEAAGLLTRVVGAERADREPDAVEEIGRLCGHLPLAVRIAAARLASRPGSRLSRMAALLRDEVARLDELTTGDLQVRASLALAYEALPPPARTLFRLASLLDAPRIPVFAAAAALDCAPRSAEALLERLVDASLLEPVECDDGAVRYRFHDLIRLFGREQSLAEDDPATRHGALRRAFGAWLACLETMVDRIGTGTLAVIRTTATRWTPAGTTSGPTSGPTDPDAATDPLAWFDAEAAALPAVIRQAAALDEAAIAWHLASAAQPVHELRGAYTEALDCHRVATEACRRAGDRLGQAVMLRNRADLWIARPGAHRDQKLVDAREALALFRELGEERGLVDALHLCADVWRAYGDHTTARRLLAEAIDTASRIGYALGERHSITHLAIIERERGHADVALTLAERFLALVQDGSNPREYTVALNLVGLLRGVAGRVDAAEEMLTRALAISRDTGDRAQVVYTLVRLGQFLVSQGRPEARGMLEEALDTSRAEGFRFGEAIALHGLGELELAEGRPRRAVRHLERAVAMTADMRAVFVHAVTLTDLGEAQARAGAHRAARQAWSRAEGLFQDLDNTTGVRRVREAIAGLPAPTRPRPAARTGTER